jgi:hypothetical protein
MATETRWWKNPGLITGSVGLLFGAAGVFLAWKADRRAEEAGVRENVADVRAAAAEEREKLTLALLAKAEEREQRASEREEEKHELETKFAYVLDEKSLKELQQPFTLCKEVDATFVNLSKYTTPLKVRVLVSGGSLHRNKDEPGKNPRGRNIYIGLPDYTLAPDRSVTHKFFLHSNPGAPVAGIALMVNDKIYQEYNYLWNDKSKQYEYVHVSKRDEAVLAEWRARMGLPPKEPRPDSK